MEYGKLPDIHRLLQTKCGNETVILTPETARNLCDWSENIIYFVWSMPMIYTYWGHPQIMENITGNCTGDERLYNFLRGRRKDIAYATPEQTVNLGLDYISAGEQSGYAFAVKAGLRTAMLLSHMAEEAEDPFLLSDEEKAVLIRARAGEVSAEERAELYRRTICPENLDKLRRMPDHPTVKKQLFVLLDEICKEELT